MKTFIQRVGYTAFLYHRQKMTCTAVNCTSFSFIRHLLKENPGDVLKDLFQDISWIKSVVELLYTGRNGSFTGPAHIPTLLLSLCKWLTSLLAFTLVMLCLCYFVILPLKHYSVVRFLSSTRFIVFFSIKKRHQKKKRSKK